MKIIYFSILVLLILFFSCSTSFEGTSNEVSLSISSHNLIINNLTSEKIYYFIVESEIVAVINWAPSTSGPFLENGKLVKIPFYDVFNGLDAPVKSGDRIIVYWWTDSFRDFNDVQFKSITL